MADPEEPEGMADAGGVGADVTDGVDEPDVVDVVDVLPDVREVAGTAIPASFPPTTGIHSEAPPRARRTPAGGGRPVIAGSAPPGIMAVCDSKRSRGNGSATSSPTGCST
ncbi:hypothetical protein ACIQAC_00565 [Streptomyces sp. NPDC088387]|uniref:hypothetical protein n=1 Tax=Streptomyces sp. NPDC088387 TaxID=3365859 RepID=UPI0037F1A212